MVVLNKIYTKTGDKGDTALATGSRRPKYDLRVEAYGTVDETNACIGMARLHTGQSDTDVDAMLGRIQNDLFDLGADLATPDTGEKLEYEPLRITQGQVDRLENEIDMLNASLQAPALLRPPPVARPQPQPCISRARFAAAPSARSSNSPIATTRRSRMRRSSTSTACPIFFSSRRAMSITGGAGDVLWVPGKNR